MGRSYMGYDSMKKAVTGGMLWVILVIIIGIVAIILFWLFLSGMADEVPDMFDDLVENFKEMIKDLLGPYMSWILG